MYMKNSLYIQGRLTRNPELRRISSGAACTSFSIANTYGEGEKESVNYFDYVSWRELAEEIAKKYKKGNFDYELQRQV